MQTAAVLNQITAKKIFSGSYSSGALANEKKQKKQNCLYPQYLLLQAPQLMKFTSTAATSTPKAAPLGPKSCNISCAGRSN
jgi:hypothetical protein